MLIIFQIFKICQCLQSTTTTPASSGCDGTQANMWSCCSGSSPCQENEGDCDIDSDCNGDLKCGKDNCPGSNFHAMADCCYEPSKKQTLKICISLTPSSCLQCSGVKGLCV